MLSDSQRFEMFLFNCIVKLQLFLEGTRFIPVFKMIVRSLNVILGIMDQFDTKIDHIYIYGSLTYISSSSQWFCLISVKLFDG